MTALNPAPPETDFGPVPGVPSIPALSLPWHWAFGPRHRTARIVGLLAGILLLSLADLYMTLLYLKSFGMAEVNPFARAIIEHNSPAGLILWKLCTVSLAIGILFYARRRATAEFAALFCCGVLLWLTLRWASYNTQVSDYTRDLNSIAASPDDPAWVSMNSGG